MSNLTVAAWRLWKGAPTEPPDPVVQAAIDAAEQAIAGYCGRAFVVASGSTTRIFAPTSDRSETIEIDDATAVTVVANSGSTIAATGYQLEPVNGINAAGMAVPYSRIRLFGTTWSQTYKGEASVSVTATFGWAAIPAAYTEAVKILSADILDNKDIRNGVAGFADIGAVRVRENASVTMLLTNAKLVRSRAGGPV